MSTRLFVGNIGEMSDRELRDLLSPHGCSAATIVRDRLTGDSRGFGFAQVENAQAAIRDLDRKKMVDGRNLHIEIARPIRARDYRSEGSGFTPR